MVAHDDVENVWRRRTAFRRQQTPRPLRRATEAAWGSETEGVVTPDWFADRSIMLPGQLGADIYEESQRRPGDFEAQVSQRPVAVHGLEHLGTTDRGITLFRNQVRRGIKAVKTGKDPVGVFRDGGAVIPTYCNDTVVRIPPAKTPELDKELLRETGRRLAQGYLEAPPLMAGAE